MILTNKEKTKMSEYVVDSLLKSHDKILTLFHLHINKYSDAAFFKQLSAAMLTQYSSKAKTFDFRNQSKRETFHKKIHYNQKPE